MIAQNNRQFHVMADYGRAGKQTTEIAAYSQPDRIFRADRGEAQQGRDRHVFSGAAGTAAAGPHQHHAG